MKSLVSLCPLGKMGVQFVLFQWIATFLVALLFWLFEGQVAGYSAILGGSINILSCLIFFRLFFKQHTTKVAKKIVFNFYLGGVLKFFIGFVLFTLAFQWSKLRPAPLFCAFIATQLAYGWILLSRCTVD